MKLKGRHSETVSDIHRKSQAVLNSIRENYFHVVSEAWGVKNNGITAYVSNETIFMEMAAKIQ
jgi:hypothetical protein